MWVWDNRKSECHFVMKRIRIEISSGAKALQTSVLVFVNKKDCRICQEKNANESNGNISLCASRYESRNGRHFGIVESAVVVGASRKEAFQRLEPCAVKVASTVLRGERRSNTLLLPDFDAPSASGLFVMINRSCRYQHRFFPQVHQQKIL